MRVRAALSRCPHPRGSCRRDRASVKVLQGSHRRACPPIRVIRLTPKTAALIGKNPTEWSFFERQVWAGRWTTGTRASR